MRQYLKAEKLLENISLTGIHRGSEWQLSGIANDCKVKAVLGEGRLREVKIIGKI
jgi:hypothetical protein